ncbi:MAG: saccharopine dehydrogenase C-terminal domain-containing protein [bacterium]
MNKVLILGAGLVSRPMVRYLLDAVGCRLTVASRTVDKAEKLVAGHPNGAAVELLVDDNNTLDRLVGDHDVTVSLLPYIYHVQVARHCISHRRHLVTTSYVSDAMRALDADAKAAGVLLLNEIGLDPGIDHMSAMAVIDRLRDAGGRVTSFRSWCGGLPAPEANDNPLGYKFSWSPKGVVMAGRNDARYLENGREVFVPGRELFGHRWTLHVEGEREFEAYPNRNSLPYIGLYGLEGIGTMLRGTLRNPGWCETLKAIAGLGLLDDRIRDNLAGLTRAAWVREHVAGTVDLRADVANRLGVGPSARVVENMAWLGMFDELPVGLDRGSSLDILARLMLDRMAYRPGERDMIVLYHEFAAEKAGRPAVNITSKLVAYGEPGGDSAMARTVSLPAAVAARFLLEGRVRLSGVHIPVVPELYRPVLEELARLGIECVERETPTA